MKFILYILTIFWAEQLICNEWSVVYSGLDSISGFSHIDDKLLMYNLGGVITEVDLDDFSSNMKSKHEGLIFSSVRNQGDLYLSLINPITISSEISISKDNGKTWFEYINEFGSDIFFGTNAIFFGLDTCIYVGCNAAQQASIAYTYDGGLTSNYLRLDNILILLTVARTEQKIFAGSGDGTVLESVDYGQSWVEVDFFQQNSSPVRFIKFDHNIGIVSNQNGEIFKSDDSGITWRKVDTGLSGNFAFHHTTFADSVIYAAGKDYTKNKGTLFLSKDYGETWHIVLENDILFRGSFIYKDHLYCVSANGNLWRANLNLVSVNQFENDFKMDVNSKVVQDRIINLDISYEEYEKFQFQLFDILGNKFSSNIIQIMNRHPLIFKIHEDVPTGIYYLLIDIDNRMNVIKLLLN